MKRLERFHNPSTIISPPFRHPFFSFSTPFPFLIVLFFIIAHGYVVIFSALRSFVGSGTWKGSQEPVSRERKGGRGESFFRPYFSFSLEGSSFFIFFFPWKPRYGPPRPRRRREEAFWRRLLPVSLPLFLPLIEADAPLRRKREKSLSLRLFKQTYI